MVMRFLTISIISPKKLDYHKKKIISAVPDDGPRDFGPEVAFGAKIQIPVARQ